MNINPRTGWIHPLELLSVLPVSSPALLRTPDCLLEQHIDTIRRCCRRFIAVHANGGCSFFRMAAWCWCVLLLSGLQTLSAHVDFFTSIGNKYTPECFLWSLTCLCYTHVEFSSSLTHDAVCHLVVKVNLFDLFHSGQMTDLLYTEKDLVTSLKDYIRAEENKLERVKRCVCVHALYMCMYVGDTGRV